MGKKALVLFLSGLYTLSSCLAHEYHFVNMNKNWTEAQRYCREKYTDLATIDNMEDMNRLINTVDSGYNGSAWVGLYNGVNSWRWSLEDMDYCGEGEAEFRNWNSSDVKYTDQHCVVTGEYGTWWDDHCIIKYHSVCYNGKTTNISERFILSNESMTWDEGQSYCRQHYTDLASVRNLAESRKIGNMVPKGNWAWIGLFRDWSWSDQSNSLFRYWHSGTPNNRYGNCVSVFGKSGKWADYTCETQLPFCCYSVLVKKTQQVMRVKLTPKDQNMDLTDPDIQEAILQQIRKELREKGMSDDVKLRWKKQPDGKIFHKEEKEKM
ncbi:C-type mannose receptor 2 [Salmo trutta]|uniref:C-type mannose receptor 2 n=1 Tax=Salmo trutta TaxID=8032 RepID=UPI001130B6EC|nr:C-type mannose receptor 2-like [Salmo trutta]